MLPRRLSPLNRMLNFAPCLLLAVLAAGPEAVELDMAALTWWLNISWVVAPVVAGSLCLRVAGASSGRNRRAWRYFAAGSFSWAVGSVIYAWYDLRGYAVPFPGYADIFFIASCVAFAAGMFGFGSPEGQAGRIQVCNFALVLCSSAISGFVLLFPQLRASTVGPLGTLVAFISPVLWLGTSIFGVLCLILYAPRSNRFSFALLIAGIIGHAVADNIYGLARLDRSYAIGVSFDWVWGASFLAIAAAATSRSLQLRSAGEQAFARAGTNRQRLAEAFVPTAAVAGVLFSGAVAGFLENGPGYLAALPIAMVFALFIGIREHWVLNRERLLRLVSRQSSRKLVASQRMLNAVLESTTDSVVVIDRDWRITYMNGQALALVGGSDRLRVGESLWSGFPEEEHGNFGARYREAFERQTPVSFEEYLPALSMWLEVHAYPRGETLSIFFRDVSERRSAAEQLQQLAHYDPLTGLANRLLFRRRVHELAQTSEDDPFAVLCIDLDLFKEINDTLGHPAGDVLLGQVGERLRSLVRGSDLVARIGGDEFAIVGLQGCGVPRLRELADQIITSLSAPYDLDGRSARVGASIGIARSYLDVADDAELLKQADIALYCAKAEGRGTARLFTPMMEQRVRELKMFKADLSVAIANREIELVFQPIIALAEDRVVGFEALMRWRHPERGLVPPDEFIPVAEETGLIVVMGDWALEHACTAARSWPDELRVAVNLSACQFQSRSFVDRVTAILDRTRLPPSRLELEITESVLLQDSDANLAILRDLKALGIRIALDDFGTGYSSLSYLHKFPFDKIKIDRSFINNLGTQETSQAIVRAVAGLGVSLHMTITAEGVENRQQLDRIRAKGCDEAQGFFFSRPIPAKDVPALLAKLALDRRWWRHGLSAGQSQRGLRPA
jgi:diguanylate cyclase (GGDEF)-like protein/PAS domain S-box-containing protein